MWYVVKLINSATKRPTHNQFTKPIKRWYEQ